MTSLHYSAPAAFLSVKYVNVRLSVWKQDNIALLIFKEWLDVILVYFYIFS